ncbi:glycosyltransferase [Sphingobacterium sp. SRCM116780]|uniref:glycosyltransferase n=1 Tax=Sphingobacterium sp. SRCM116780 TaxID=2907623 RepID=UPI001F2036CB|nr:glycosyltransferase [Sphingobacterium sp. SRCM116780]UIR56307.1 glycosyltransferase [Sphingobacterium sp. SRCM116780]
MKIAFFNSIKSWGGGEKWHFDAAIHFASIGHDVYFFGDNDSKLKTKLIAFPHITYIPVYLTNFSFLNPVKRCSLTAKFQELQIETILINNPKDLKIAAYAAHTAKVSRIIYRRGSAIPIKNTFLNQRIFGHYVTDILANSQATKETILSNNPKLFPIEKIKVIYNPIDIDRFDQLEYKKIVPNRNNDDLIIGNLARLAPQKNQKFLIDLSAELSRQNISHKIYITGKGELENELKTYNLEKGTDKNVRFLGFTDSPRSFLIDIDVFILSSHWEGFGYVLAEASLAEKPIIAFNCSSNPELVVDGVTGFLTNTDSIPQIIEKIKILKNPILRNKMGLAGRKFVLDSFDEKSIYGKLEAYILGKD